MSTTDVDAVVVGAGVVGLASARALALRGRQVLVLEAAEAVGTGTSSRNSGVIHAGLYYPTGSLKARLCVAGRRQLYAYLAERGVPHARTGKLVVAVDDGERDALAVLAARARANGVEGLRELDGAGLHALEPEVRGVAALLSESTGIVDPHALMLALEGDLEAAGGLVVLRTSVRSIRREAGVLVVETDSQGASATLRCRELVNAAGLAAGDVAAAVESLPGRARPRTRFAVGHYYALSGPAPFSRLVYPLPDAAGLGVHFTLDLGGGGRFGPDVRWRETADLAFDDGQRESFVAAIRRWWPSLDPDRLVPGHVGVRPKLVGPGEAAADFLVATPADHGLAGYVGLHGIESPGLTASLALGDAVADALEPSA